MGYQGLYCKFVKRGIDIACAVLAMGVFCWLYVIVAILVWIKLGRPIIFHQERPGKIDHRTGKEKIFRLYKFRSMTNERDENGVLKPDEERLTKFGKAIRSMSLDELPEAWNILKGDMSVVGPRPLLVRYLDLYDDRARQRHLVRPGLSGLAQINGRNHESWKDRFSDDVEYTQKVSFVLDIWIVVQTVYKVLKHDGIEYLEDVQSIDDYFASKKDA